MVGRILLDFTPVRNGESSLGKLAAGLTRDDLRRLTNEMIDTMLDLIAGCEDADVTFVPEDPDADDPHADSDAEAHVAWTLGHVIVHTTASAEEAAALAAELARGVNYHGRSRSEVPWETVTTLAQCRYRLEESRRIRLASLDMWPDRSHPDSLPRRRSAEPRNAVARFLKGLKHDDDHLGQIAGIVRQARAARG